MMPQDQQYPIVETFLSVQGEGIFSGARAFFIRTGGCCVRCPWCDTKNSWGRDSDFIRLGAMELAEKSLASGADFAVITGGEPCMHNLEPLFKALNSAGVKVHLETSGVIFPGENAMKYCDWTTLSPKLFARPATEMLEIADELKFVVGNPSELDLYDAFLEAAKNAGYVWLNPEWSKRADSDLLKAMFEHVLKKGSPYRLGWQLHKNYFVR